MRYSCYNRKVAFFKLGVESWLTKGEANRDTGSVYTQRDSFRVNNPVCCGKPQKDSDQKNSCDRLSGTTARMAPDAPICSIVMQRLILRATPPSEA